MDGRRNLGAFELPAHDLLTHAVIVGSDRPRRNYWK